jgi:hypothetical protein
MVMAVDFLDHHRRSSEMSVCLRLNANGMIVMVKNLLPVIHTTVVHKMIATVAHRYHHPVMTDVSMSLEGRWMHRVDSAVTAQVSPHRTVVVAAVVGHSIVAAAAAEEVDFLDETVGEADELGEEEVENKVVVDGFEAMRSIQVESQVSCRLEHHFAEAAAVAAGVVDSLLLLR